MDSLQINHIEKSSNGRHGKCGVTFSILELAFRTNSRQKLFKGETTLYRGFIDDVNRDRPIDAIAI